LSDPAVWLSKASDAREAALAGLVSWVKNKAPTDFSNTVLQVHKNNMAG
jgi:hypothetical protein